MLEMQQITKVYRTELVETHALRSLDLHVEAGEFVAVTGPSGSGKTTFLNIAGLLETYSSGIYRLDGEDVSHLNDNARSKLRNRKIGFIFQSFNLIPDLNLFDNADVPLRYRGMSGAERRERIEQALARVGLGARMKHYPAELSGGQQQRAAIARALAGSPKLLLADEPTGNLDTNMARGVMELLEEINQQGTTIVMVTHDPELAARAQRNVHIVDGMATDLASEPAADPRRAACTGQRAGIRKPHVRLLLPARTAQLPPQQGAHRADGAGHRAGHRRLDHHADGVSRAVRRSDSPEEQPAVPPAGRAAQSRA